MLPVVYWIAIMTCKNRQHRSRIHRLFLASRARSSPSGGLLLLHLPLPPLLRLLLLLLLHHEDPFSLCCVENGSRFSLSLSLPSTVGGSELESSANANKKLRHDSPLAGEMTEQRVAFPRASSIAGLKIPLLAANGKKRRCH